MAEEELESVIGTVRLVCDSVIQAQDVQTAKRAAQAAMRREWCDAKPEALPAPAKPRFQRLSDVPASGKLQVKLLPDECFGLIHGKAGAITLADGRKTAFLGSVNESLTAWRLNYELLWEDGSDDAVDWVQEAFDTLWDSPFAVGLADAVVQEIKRRAHREVVSNLEDWRAEPDPAAAIVVPPCVSTARSIAGISSVSMSEKSCGIANSRCRFRSVTRGGLRSSGNRSCTRCHASTTSCLFLSLRRPFASRYCRASRHLVFRTSSLLRISRVQRFSSSGVMGNLLPPFYPSSVSSLARTSSTMIDGAESACDAFGARQSRLLI